MNALFRATIGLLVLLCGAACGTPVEYFAVRTHAAGNDASAQPLAETWLARSWHPTRGATISEVVHRPAGRPAERHACVSSASGGRFEFRSDSGLYQGVGELDPAGATARTRTELRDGGHTWARTTFRADGWASEVEVFDRAGVRRKVLRQSARRITADEFAAAASRVQN